MQNANLKSQNKNLKFKNIQKLYFRRARIVAFVLQLAPFIRMVGLNGSLSRGKAKKSSDIDFLIICKKGRIWTCRTFVTLITQFTGLRRYGQKIAGRICLNRYQTDDFLEIFYHNDYYARCFSALIPLFDADEIYEKYLKKNQWMKKLGYKFPQKISKNKPNYLFLKIRLLSEKFLTGKLGNFLENKLKKWQKKRILSDKRTHEAPQGRVRVSDKELCFNPLKR